MRHLTNNDRHWKWFTVGPWSKTFGIMLCSGGEDDDLKTNSLRLVGFGWVLRITLPQIIRPWKIKVDAMWDAETVARLGRNWYYNIHEREFGFSFSDMGNGYDFLSVHFGAQTNDSSTRKTWCKHLPWKQRRMVRFSLYDAQGNHFWTEQREKKRKGLGCIRDQMDMVEQCSKVHFGFEDYDGDMIVATTHIEEREYKKGEGWFKWVSLFRKREIYRSLDIKFSAEVGPEKGSWKGGTLGHGITMLPGEVHEQAFRRYCEMDHERKGRIYRLRFIGPCAAPKPRPVPVFAQDDNCKQSGCKTL